MSLRTVATAPAAQAVLAQVAAWSLALGATGIGALPAGHPWALAASQGIAAALLARWMGAPPWWWAIHAGFTPALLAATTWHLAPGWYLSGFVLLALFYWSSYRTQVPLYLSNAATVAAIAELVPSDRPSAVLDLGSGIGSFIRPLARLRPQARCVGFEMAPGSLWLGRLLGKGIANLTQRRADFWGESWREYALVYAFLSPVPMARIGAKAAAELGPQAVLISNSFPIPDRKPDFVLDLKDRRRTRLYGYRFGPSRQSGQ
ncbi:MAG: methyltransferase type 12 [Zoogloeaceae bacterium]|nr:methyltransferase type 12 [Zoogloeaceae bacterium]